MVNPTNPQQTGKRGDADYVYYGQKFKPYGPDWIKNGLLNYVPADVITEVILKSVRGNKLLSDNAPKLPKEKIVEMLMAIYDKADNDGKSRIEKWVYAYRYRRKVSEDYPFLKRLDSFYKYLRTNNHYKMAVPPDVAVKVASQLTLTGIEKLDDVKSVLRSSICKRQEEWDIFPSLFDAWFKNNIKSYGMSSKTQILPNYKEFKEATIESEDDVLAELRKVVANTSQEVKNLGLDQRFQSAQGDETDKRLDTEQERPKPPEPEGENKDDEMKSGDEDDDEKEGKEGEDKESEDKDKEPGEDEDDDEKSKGEDEDEDEGKDTGEDEDIEDPFEDVPWETPQERKDRENREEKEQKEREERQQIRMSIINLLKSTPEKEMERDRVVSEIAQEMKIINAKIKAFRS
jgi:hypothetical protein